MIRGINTTNENRLYTRWNAAILAAIIALPARCWRSYFQDHGAFKRRQD
jgi:hypothetical protein